MDKGALTDYIKRHKNLMYLMNKSGGINRIKLRVYYDSLMKQQKYLESKGNLNRAEANKLRSLKTLTTRIRFDLNSNGY